MPDDLAQPQTVAVAVAALLAALSPEERRSAPAAEEALSHFRLGLWARNAFGLHGRNKALLRACSEEWLRRGGWGRPDYNPVLLGGDYASGFLLELAREAFRAQPDSPAA